MRQIAFWAAVIGVALLLATAIIGGATYPGYSHIGQYLSELGATGAPHGTAVNWLGYIPSAVLQLAFWVIALMVLPKSPLAVIGLAGLMLNMVGFIGAGVYPCDFACVRDDPSQSQMLHDLFAGLGYLAGIAGIFLLGAAARSWAQGRHLFALSLACGIPAALAIWLIHPDFAAYGAAQRVVEVALAIWTIGCALVVRRWPSRASAA